MEREEGSESVVKKEVMGAGGKRTRCEAIARAVWSPTVRIARKRAQATTRRTRTRKMLMMK